MPFQKGNQLAKGHNGGLRRDPTIELITQLNELCKNYDGSKRTKLNRMIRNLITKATTGDDVLDANGNIVKEGTGDLTAILAIIDRLEFSEGCLVRNQAMSEVNDTGFLASMLFVLTDQFHWRRNAHRVDAAFEQPHVNLFDCFVFDLHGPVVWADNFLAGLSFEAVNDCEDRVKVTGALFHDVAVRVEHIVARRCFGDQISDHAVQLGSA